MKRLCALLFALSLQAADRCVVVPGLGGEPEYESRFQSLAAEAGKLMGSGCQIAGSTRAALQSALNDAAVATAGGDSFTLLLIGHGTFDGHVYKFNVSGPDISAGDLRAWLDPIPGRQLVVLSTSASGAALDALKSPNRTVITATRSGTEKNAVVFTRFWVDALRDATADTDKNEAVSAQEAFEYARQKTTAFYETQKRLATEHPQIDNAALAARLSVARFGSAQKAFSDPRKRALLARREQLEAAIDALKREKAALPLADYRTRLTALLVQLAQVQQEIDK